MAKASELLSRIAVEPESTIACVAEMATWVLPTEIPVRPTAQYLHRAVLSASLRTCSSKNKAGRSKRAAVHQVSSITGACVLSLSDTTKALGLPAIEESAGTYVALLTSK